MKKIRNLTIVAVIIVGASATGLRALAQSGTSTTITTNASALKVITAAQTYIGALQTQLTTAQTAATNNAAAAADDANQKTQNAQFVSALNTLNASLPAASQVTGP